MEPVYLDHAATTPLAPGVLEAMLPYLSDGYGNASSVHARGRAARHALEEARSRIGRAFGLAPEGVWLTSGGTEADNTALRGVASARPGAVVTCAAEHQAVLSPARRLADEGRDVVILDPGADGAVDPDAVRAALDRDVSVVSIMAANNEVGTRSAIGELAALCAERGVPLHTDAVQLAAYADVSPEATGADLVTVSAHKIGGPVGAGALLVRPGTPCDPLIVGGGQERGRRAGTENVAAAVGFAAAAEWAVGRREHERDRLASLRDLLAARLRDGLGDRVSVTTPLDRSAPHILHCTFGEPHGRRPDGEMLLLGLDLDGVQASAGSACASGAVEPSHVLRAMGFGRAEASASLRLSLGHTTTRDDIERAVPVIVRTVIRVSG